MVAIHWRNAALKDKNPAEYRRLRDGLREALKKTEREGSGHCGTIAGRHISRQPPLTSDREDGGLTFVSPVASRL